MKYLVIGIGLIFTMACGPSKIDKQVDSFSIEVYRSSASGEQFKLIDEEADSLLATESIQLFPDKEFQTIRGFGGAFTEATAHLYKGLSKPKQKELIEAYFGAKGANYTICRTHINSCDFSLSSYAYAMVPNDTNLEHFSIERDEKAIIPMIKDAMSSSENGFELIASPWTAPPWMKDNQAWFAGSLKKEFYPTWAQYFLKYYQAYQAEGIPISSFTVENEPLGNDSNWESMHFTAAEMGEFVSMHLGPLLKDSAPNVEIFLYDQNRDQELLDWSEHLLSDSSVMQYSRGTAVHWYASTVNSFTEALDRVHAMDPEKEIIQSEACIDNDIPRWREDDWYWSRSATDWGYEWAKPEDKHLHPEYVPVHRYASDIINCLNHHVTAWIDWNMVLNRKGGPNHAQNWCVAPVIVDEQTDEIYYTPLYYTMMHFSRFIRPDAKRIDFDHDHKELMVTAAKNTDGSLVVVLFNPGANAIQTQLKLEGSAISRNINIPANSIETIYLKS